jgi:hypothetical protein
MASVARGAIAGAAVVAALVVVGVAGAGSGARSAKRGIASAQYLASDPTQLSRLGARWAYDWSATKPPAGGPEWVPMVWGTGSVTPGVIASLAAARRAGSARYLLGFNEPDLSSQANMTPERAASLWPQLERTGLRLGSPAPASPDDGWLARFMVLARARNLRVDFIALHFYQDFTDPAAVVSLRRQLVAVHRVYGKPIWITEIGAMDIRSWHEPMRRSPTRTLAQSYMRRLFAMLDALPFVQRYAWFTDDCWRNPACRYSSLFTGTGHVTPIGETFLHAS